MKGIKILFCVFFVIGVINCKENVDSTSPNTSDVVINKIIDSVSVQINYGQEASIENNITIKFDGVNDSRCPKDVICVWAGDGEVGLMLSKGNDRHHIILHTTLFPREINFVGYRIILKSLNPYPKSASSTKLDEYNVDLIIKR
jgi:hypothetical protein